MPNEKHDSVTVDTSQDVSHHLRSLRTRRVPLEHGGESLIAWTCFLARRQLAVYPRFVRLAVVFNDALRARGIDPTGDVAEQDTTLQAAHDAGTAIFSLELEPERYARYVGERAANAEALESMALEDLFLACACAAGSNEALEAFEARYAPEIRLALRHVPDAIPMADEITQSILSQLLFPSERGTRGIESYRGRGGLFSWLRVVAVRQALRELSKGQKEAPLGDEQILAALEPGPDLGYMKELYRDAFRRAFSGAMANLDSEARTLLRHHYVQGLSIDKLSLLHRVHRATAARRLAKAREELLGSTRRALMSELRVTSEELDSIMRLIDSNLDASMRGLLSSSEG